VTGPADPVRDDAPKGGRAVASQGIKYAVVIEADGRTLELKEFLHDVIGGAVTGLLEGLRGVDAPRRVRVDVRRL
jgi:hypothetical protein